ncbi:MAG: hypothetical protein IKL90_02965 [Alphaproteobacteria bacterium]|nr:hypothetical protein [Alphaproteobacteria bacterium]MBR6730288.1 hypothetical protein [Alphaproteobacteria bacterium]
MTKKENKEKSSQLEKIALQIEKMRLGDYINNMNRPAKIIVNNLLGGISKGVGLTVGATLVIALLFKILSVIISMNIPYLTETLQEVVSIIKATPVAGIVEEKKQECDCAPLTDNKEASERIEDVNAGTN